MVEGAGRRIAIECDGDRYHPIEKLPEDMERQAILERLGWRFIRIRGSAFFRDPDATMEGVFARLDEMDITPLGLNAPGEAPTEPHCFGITEQIIRRAAEIRTTWAAAEAEAGEVGARLSEGSTGPEGRSAPGGGPPGRQSSADAQGNALKEAWELTLEEWTAQVADLKSTNDLCGLQRIGGVYGYPHHHRMQVEKAIDVGKPVPPAVLEGYPDLALRARR